MNTIRTRNALHQANTRQRHEGDTKPIDRHIALICAIGLLAIIMQQIYLMVAA